MRMQAYKLPTGICCSRFYVSMSRVGVHSRVWTFLACLAESCDCHWASHIWFFGMTSKILQYTSVYQGSDTIISGSGPVTFSKSRELIRRRVGEEHKP
eukprot:jgi/Botrbrau1/1453/Bobra.178_3s0011.1